MASRSADKKPVGFATQLTAGGIAGAMEAVRNSLRARVATPTDCMRILAMLPTSRYDQGPNAALAVWARTRGECSSPWLVQSRLGHFGPLHAGAVGEPLSVHDTQRLPGSTPSARASFVFPHRCLQNVGYDIIEERRPCKKAGPPPGSCAHRVARTRTAASHIRPMYRSVCHALGAHNTAHRRRHAGSSRRAP